MQPEFDITLITHASLDDIRKFASQSFGDMVKGVIDIETGKMAFGGELHADEEQYLLEDGSLQHNLWGFNIYVNESFPENIEFDSLINIRPAQNNLNRSISDEKIRGRIINLLASQIFHKDA